MRTETGADASLPELFAQSDAQETDALRCAADAVARSEMRYETFTDDGALAARFYELTASGRFVPDAQVLRGAARGHSPLSACFVLPVEDSMEGIFNAVKDAALVRKYGGGVGFSLSRLRPEGAAVRSTGGTASGPVGFLRVFGMADGAVRTQSAADGNLCVLRVDHPDIAAFLRRLPEGAPGLRLAVGLTDAFLDAARADGEYELTDPHTHAPAGTLRAKDVLDRIAAAAASGVQAVFLDAVNRDNVVPMQGKIEAADPVAGQPLLPYESCVLGAVDLAKMARDGKVDYALLRETVHDAVHFLDNAVDASRFPLDEISRTSRATRKLGLGVMNFARLLEKIGVPYDCDDAVALAENLMGFVNTEGHAASTALAARRGSFPLYAESIYQHGAPMRNATVTAVAPACPEGCTPGCAPAPGMRVPPERRVRMLAAVQKHTDNAAWDEIVLPAGSDPSEAGRLLLLAAELGCKIVSIRVEKSEKEDEKTDIKEKKDNIQEVSAAPEPGSDGAQQARRTPRTPRERPDVTSGTTRRVRAGCGDLYVTVNADADGVCEVFVRAEGQDVCQAQCEAVARLATLALRAGVSPGEICAQLRGVRCAAAARCGAEDCASCPEAVARALEEAAGGDKTP